MFKYIKARNKTVSKLQYSKILKLSFNKSHQLNPLQKVVYHFLEVTQV